MEQMHSATTEFRSCLGVSSKHPLQLDVLKFQKKKKKRMAEINSFIPFRCKTHKECPFNVEY